MFPPLFLSLFLLRLFLSFWAGWGGGWGRGQGSTDTESRITRGSSFTWNPREEAQKDKAALQSSARRIVPRFALLMCCCTREGAVSPMEHMLACLLACETDSRSPGQDSPPRSHGRGSELLA